MDALFARSDLACSLLLGENGDLDPELSDQFEKAGIGHILSVSGVYLFLYAKVLEYLLRLCRVPKKWREGAGIALFALFLLVFGENTAVWRMAIFYGLTKLASIFWKKSDDLTLLSAAFLATVLLHPAKVYDLGVQYSYAAVFSLICLMPYFERLFSWLRPVFLAKAMSSVLCLNIGLLPLLIRQENAIWVFSLLANLFVTLYLAMLLPLLTGFTLLFGIFGSAVSFLGAWGDSLLALLEAFAGRAEIWQGAKLTLPSPSAGMLLFWFALIFLASRRNFLSWRPKTVVCALFASAVAVAIFLPGMPNREIRVEFLSADGLCAVVRAENGSCAVIGVAGGRNSAEYLVKNGLSPEHTFCLSKDGNSIEAMERLHDANRTGAVWACPDVARVLRERSGIECEEMGDAQIKLSPRCSLIFFYGQRSGAIEEVRILIDGRTAGLFCLTDEGPIGAERFGVLYWEGADRTPLAKEMACDAVILRIPQWGAALPAQRDGEKSIYNLYEAGMVTAYFGKQTRLEARYGSN